MALAISGSAAPPAVGTGGHGPDASARPHAEGQCIQWPDCNHFANGLAMVVMGWVGMDIGNKTQRSFFTSIGFSEGASSACQHLMFVRLGENPCRTAIRRQNKGLGIVQIIYIIRLGCQNISTMLVIELVHAKGTTACKWWTSFAMSLSER